MNRTLLLLTILFTSFKVQPQEAANALTPIVGFSESQLEIIHDHIKAFPNGTNVAMALIDGKQTIFYGAERENDSLVTINNSDAVFEIGSITKVFTAILLTQEVVDGKLQLDQQVSELLNMTFHTGDEMTLEELASHTSGMPRLAGDFFEHVKDESNPYKDYTPELLTQYLSKKLKVSDKKEYAYSNTGVALLGHALSVQLDTPYTTLVKNRILQPLQMRASVFGANNAGEKLVPGLNPAGKPTSNWDMNVHAPAGGILSSVADLEHFVRAQFDPKNKALALARTSVQNIRENVDVCLGWHMRKNKESKWHSHSGGTGGYRSVLVVDVDQQKAIILLSNVSAFHFLHQRVEHLGAELMKSLY